MHPLNGKIFFDLKTPSLIWTKGAEMHTHFRGFLQKKFAKIYPFTYSHWRRPNAYPESQKILPLHLFGIERSKRNLFFRKKAKKLPANIGGHSQA